MPTEFAPVTVAVPGTCGELVQGWHAAWDQAVLVSCPITCTNQLTVQLQEEPVISVLGSPPAASVKLRQAARLALDAFDAGQRPDLGAHIRVSRQLPLGRGMASSTADVVAVLAAVALALGLSPPPAKKLARLACCIEPSDSTMFAELTLLAYRDEGRHETLGRAPALPLLLLDTGRVVDTLAYNAHLDLAASRRLAASTEMALTMLKMGLSTQDAVVIGAAASLSAQSYQAVNPSPLVAQAQPWVMATGAVGLVRAHSGSLVGLLYPPETELAEPAAWLASRFRGQLSQTQLTGGGYLLVEHQIEPSPTNPEYIR